MNDTAKNAAADVAAPAAPAKTPRLDPRKVGAYIATLPEKKRPDMLDPAGWEKAVDLYIAHLRANPEAAPTTPEGEPSTTILGLYDPAKGIVTHIQTAPTSGRGSTPEVGSPLGMLLDRMRAFAATRPDLVLVQVKPRG